MRGDRTKVSCEDQRSEQSGSILDKLVILVMILIPRRCIVYVVCWVMSTRKDIFDTFIKGGGKMYKSLERRTCDNAVVTIKVLI